ncbi:serine/arginine repetitive matrix protein 2-like [Bos indicus]|uniref:Serine/arginine repetitive matrix protein 2-like n=1 Tax=Bos indicus TaxID=9915 RepID=A0ABM4QKF4_BOSIN
MKRRRRRAQRQPPHPDTDSQDTFTNQALRRLVLAAPAIGRRRDDPARSPGRPAITDLGFRAQKLRAGPRERGRDEDGQCGGPALPARAGSGGADARKRPRRGPAARAHLSPSPRVGRRRAQARRGRGRSRERRVGPAPQSCTAPGASPPDRSRYRRRRRRRRRFCCRLSFQDGRPRGGASRASSSGARLVEAAALDGQAEVACISLSPLVPGGRSSRRMRTDRQLRGAENELRAGLAQSATAGPPVGPSATSLSAAAGLRGPPTLHVPLLMIPCLPRENRPS